MDLDVQSYSIGHLGISTSIFDGGEALSC